MNKTVEEQRLALLERELKRLGSEPGQDERVLALLRKMREERRRHKPRWE